MTEAELDDRKTSLVSHWRAGEHAPWEDPECPLTIVQRHSTTTTHFPELHNWRIGEIDGESVWYCTRCRTIRFAKL